MSENRITVLTHSVISNHLILTSIFKNLSLNDLKTCRLINSEWNAEATKVLRSQYITKEITLRKEHFYPTDKYTVSLLKNLDIRNKILKTDTLENFMQLLSKSTSTLFPCNNLSLSDGHYLCNSEELQDFFWSYGKHINRLELAILYDYDYDCEQQVESNFESVEEILKDRDQENELLAALQKLLVFQLTNLKHLILTDLPQEWKWKSHFKFPSGFKIDKLETLDVQSLRHLQQVSTFTFVHELIHVASNLKKVYYDQ